MMERVALSAGRCGSECVEYSQIAQNDFEDMKIQVYPMDYEEFCDVTGNS